MFDSKLYKEIKDTVDEIKIDFGGGCSVEKGYAMAWLIKIFKIKKTIDIGVYRGRSFFPQVIAHKNYSKGIVYGIDPYNKQCASESDNLELKNAIDSFVEITDFDDLYNQVLSILSNKKFEKNGKIIRKRSEDAIGDFIGQNSNFGLIHIDGNHDTVMVKNDVNLYLPLLRKNGFLVMDDVSWSSVVPTTSELEKKMTLVYKKVNNNNDFAIYWNNNSGLFGYIMNKFVNFNIDKAMKCK